MLKNICTALLVAAVLSFGAWAEDDDHIMGNYQGQFSSKGWESKTIRAEVIAMSKAGWRVNLFVGDGSKEQKYESLPAKLDGDTAEIEADTQAGKLKGKLKNETFTGKVGDGEFALKRVILESPTQGKEPPAGAISLMNGKNIAENWVRDPEQWCLQEDGSMEVCSSSLRTKQEFGDAEYHIEFRCPFKPNSRDQERGNSGCYFLGRYEVQVLDNFGDPPADNWCGGLYHKAKPLLGASFPPLTWQTYDVTFITAKFDASGKKTSDAEITVYLNGKLIHDHAKLDGPTPGGISDQDGATGPLLLQDHNNPVRYRNIWVKPLK